MSNVNWETPASLDWVAGIIRAKSRKGFVQHFEIVEALLTDVHPEINILQLASESDKPPSWIAGNMVAYFSKQLASERSRLHQSFERKRVRGNWAYRWNSEAAGAN